MINLSQGRSVITMCEMEIMLLLVNESEVIIVPFCHIVTNICIHGVMILILGAIMCPSVVHSRCTCVNNYLLIMVKWLCYCIFLNTRMPVIEAFKR